MTMEKFLEELRRVVINDATLIENLNIDSAHIVNDELIVNIRTDRGVSDCINIHQYHIWSCETHQMMIEEIWIGYDAEGAPWSDHMGGKTIDCSGLKANAAINEIKDALLKMIKE